MEGVMDQRKPVLSQKSGLLADMLGIDPRKSDSIPFLSVM